MKHDVLPVQIRGILPAPSGCALFIGNDEKVFVINVESQMGAVIGMFLRDAPKERPLTHDLINRMFQGFGISVERVVITDLKNSPASFSSNKTSSPGRSWNWMPVPATAWRSRPHRKSRFSFPPTCLPKSRT